MSMNPANRNRRSYTDVRELLIDVASDLAKEDKTPTEISLRDYVHRVKNEMLANTAIDNKLAELYDNRITRVQGYKPAMTYITLRCAVHGNFMSTFHNLLNGYGCPRCNADRAGTRFIPLQIE